jgi:type IV pilus assembly protein PilE
MDRKPLTQWLGWRRNRGFTLVELMVTAAIAAILAAIALASYNSQMKKGRRAAAESTLMDIVQREQQYLLDARQYGNQAALNPTIPTSVTQFYTITITPNNAATPPSFTATAAPIAGTVQASDYTLTIDNTGAKTPAGVW